MHAPLDHSQFLTSIEPVSAVCLGFVLCPAFQSDRAIGGYNPCDSMGHFAVPDSGIDGDDGIQHRLSQFV